MKKILFIILITLFHGNSLAVVNDNSIVAIVNEDLITSFDLNKRIALVMKLSGIKRNLASNILFKKQILQTLIDETLVEQYANKVGIKLSNTEFDKYLNLISNQNDFKAPEEMIKALNVNKEEFYQQLKTQVLLKKIIANEIAPHIKITNKELEDNKNISFKLQKQDTNNKKISLSEIVLYKNDDNKQDIKKILAKLYNEIKQGAKFENLAKQFSQSSTRESSGLIGWLDITQLSDQFYTAVNNLKIGQISKPIETEDSVVILKVNNKEKFNNTPQNHKTLNETELYNLLYNRKLNSHLRKFFNHCRQDSFIEIKEQNLY